jgi:hypothetical protein
MALLCPPFSDPPNSLCLETLKINMGLPPWYPWRCLWWQFLNYRIIVKRANLGDRLLTFSSLTICRILDKLLNLSEPQFLYL